MRTRITGGRLIVGERILDADLLLADGVIEAILDRSVPHAPSDTVINAEGLYVSAGFVDIHQHGGGGADYMDAEADTYLSATEAHLRHGMTSVMPTLLSADTGALLRAIDAYKQAATDRRIRAHLIGMHIEGPYISPRQAGAQKPEHIRTYDEAEYRAIVTAGEGHIKRWSTAPELAGADGFAAFAREHGITLSIAHSDADIDTVRHAYDTGFRHITHFYSCMSSITRRGGFRVAGVLEAGYLLDGMDVEIIADGCHLPPDLLTYVTAFKPTARIALVTDAMRAAGEDVTESYLGSKSDPLPVVIEDGVAKMLDRQAFAGSIATCDRLVRTMVQNGTPLPTAVAMVTENPIRMMRPDLKKGSIREGYDADLCLFDEDIRIRAVLLDGKRIELS